VSLFSSQQLLAAHRDRLRELGVGGPRAPEEMLTRYLRAEQGRGRLTASADPEAMAQLLLGACFQQAFLADYSGVRPAEPELATLARRLVAGVLATTSAAGGC
jgi:hypothetical protein